VNSIGSIKSIENIPRQLKSRKQWVCWCAECAKENPEKIIKRPYSGRNASQPASVAKPRHWAYFEDALAQLDLQRDVFETRSAKAGCPNLYGLGFVLTDSDPYVGVDLDSVFDGNGSNLLDWAKNIVSALDSYTEVSPSGTGLRIFAEGRIPAAGKRKGNHASGGIEVYQSGRYLTLTGNVYDG